MTVRRFARRWPTAYYGIVIGVWINLLFIDRLHVSPMGWVLVGCGQLLIHEAWPRRVPRRKKALGDRYSEKIHKVL